MKKFFCLFVFLCLFVSNAFADVAINETNFPDSIFRNYVSDNFDLDENGTLSNEEVNSVEKIEVLDTIIEVSVHMSPR